MQAVFSDISGKELIKHMVEAKDFTVILGGVIFHASQEEQIEIVEFIAKLQEERMPEIYSGDFEPYTNGRKILDSYFSRKEEAEARKANPVQTPDFEGCGPVQDEEEEE